MIHETKISSEKPWEFAQRLFLSALDVLGEPAATSTFLTCPSPVGLCITLSLFVADFKPVPQCGSGALGTAGGHGNQARAAVAAPQQPAGMPHPDLDPESLARASMEFLTVRSHRPLSLSRLFSP